MNGLSDYLDRLRELIPARTLTLYLLGTGLISGIANTPEDIAKSYAWLVIVLTVICLVVNFVGRLVDKQGIAGAAISSGAFLLFALTQRYTGPLAALDIKSPGVFVLITILAAAYVVLITMVWHLPASGSR
jgi:hypothetical protein